MKHLTTKLVAAYVSRNAVAVGDVADLIQATYSALAATIAPTSEPSLLQQPAVPIKKSVTADAVICLECGRLLKSIKRHIGTAHGLTVDEYRVKWSLPADYPMVAPNYAAHRSELAVKIGLGRKPKGQKPVEGVAAMEEAAPVADQPAHHYPASRWSKLAG